MKLVIIGATGHVGSRVMSQALATGHAVTTITPHPETVRRRKRLKVVRGSTSDPGAVAHAARGADVVVVSLTGKTRDGTLMQARLPSIIRGLKRAGSPRLVLVSAFGAGDTIDKAPWYMRLVYRYVLGRIMHDKTASDNLLMASGIPWTIIYPVNLKNSVATGTAVSLRLDQVTKVPGLPILAFDDAAAAILAAAEDPDTQGSQIIVTTAKGFRRA